MHGPVVTTTPPGSPQPIGPYHHVARAGSFIMIGGVAGIDPATGTLEGPGVAAQTTRIVDTFRRLLDSVGADLAHVLHVNVFLVDVADFAEMNRAYAAAMGEHRPARTAIGVAALPIPGARLTMNLTAVTREAGA